MDRDLSPREARAGVISGRVVTVLVVSSVGALIALGAVWAFLFRT